MFHQVLALIHSHKEKHKSDVPLFITLTVPNVKADELTNRLNLMAKAWKLLSDRKKFKEISRSWFRALEITYNKEKDTYHPHFHVLLIVRKSYFRTDRNLYISQEEWLEMWREVTGLSEITQVDIRKVRKRKHHPAEESASAEVAKYATKPSSYISGDIETGFTVEEPTVISVLHKALKNRRLTGFGGEFKSLRKKLKQADVENADLVKVSDENTGCECEVCQSTLVEQLFGWHVGARDYVHVRDE
jgi:plasmid rolling circle replication initiator protein Rep